MTQPMITSSICAGIGAGALDERVQHLRGEVGRVPAGRRPPLRPPAVRAAATM